MSTTPNKLLSRIRQAFKHLKVKPLPPKATRLLVWDDYGCLKAADPLAALAVSEGKIAVKIGNVKDRQLLENQLSFEAGNWTRKNLGNEFVSGFNAGYDGDVASPHADEEYLQGFAAGEFVASRLVPAAPTSIQVTAPLRGRSLEF